MHCRRGGLLIRHHIEDEYRRVRGQPAIDRRANVYLTDDARSGMWDLFARLCFAMLARTLHELAVRGYFDRYLEGGESLRANMQSHPHHSKSPIAIKSKSQIPIGANQSIADATRAFIAHLGHYRTAHDERLNSAVWKNDSARRDFELSIIAVQTTLSKHFEERLSKVGEAMTIEHLHDALGHCLPARADDAIDFDQLMRHAYYGKFYQFMMSSVVPDLEAYAMEHGLASGFEIRRLMEMVFPKSPTVGGFASKA